MVVQTKQLFETLLPDNPKLNPSYSAEFMIVLKITLSLCVHVCSPQTLVV